MTMKQKYRIEQVPSEGRIFIAAHTDMQVEIKIDDEGIIVDITRRNDVLATCQAAKVKS